MHHKSKLFNHIYGEIIKKISYERPLKKAHAMAQAFEVVGNNEMFINLYVQRCGIIKKLSSMMYLCLQ